MGKQKKAKQNFSSASSGFLAPVHFYVGLVVRLNLKITQNCKDIHCSDISRANFYIEIRSMMAEVKKGALRQYCKPFWIISEGT